MDLTRVFRLKPNSRIAFVGSGGKTSAMFQLARAHDGLVLLTTTTHLAVNQLELADSYHMIQNAQDLPRSRSELEGKVVLLVGPSSEDGRVGGLEETVLDKLRGLAEQWDCPLLIEADGARKLPLKAPAAHEPAVPGFCTGVVVSVGLNGLGKPLGETWVHRPERFAELSGTALGEKINSEALIKVITSPAGGLKDLPERSWKLLLINQIDTFPNWRSIKDHLPALLSGFHAVVFATLEGELVLEVHERIAGIVLAAGGSSRYGKAKQFLEWKGQPFISRVAQTALEAGLDPVLAVIGSKRKRAREMLKDLPVNIVLNPEWEAGQSSSVKRGVEALPDHLGGVVFLLVDQPQIPAEIVCELLDRHARRLTPITALQIDGRKAHPVLFDRAIFPDLHTIRGDAGGRLLFEQHQVDYLVHDDHRLGIDVDSPDDYQRLTEQFPEA
jgi:molybdenum cofactor cytidylyltransferase